MEGEPAPAGDFHRRRHQAGRFIPAAISLAAFAAVLGWLWAAFRTTEPMKAARDAASSAPLRPRVTEQIPVGAEPAAVAAGESGLWVSIPGVVREDDDPCSSEVVRIDPRTSEIAARIRVNGWTNQIAVGAGAVWVEGATGGAECAGAPEQAVVTRVDPGSETVSATILLGDTSEGRGRTRDIAVGEGGVWVSRILTNEPDLSAEVVRIDPTANSVLARIPLEGDARNVMAGEGAVWVYNLGGEPGRTQELVHIDPSTNRVAGAFWRPRLPDDLKYVGGVLSVGLGERYLWATVWKAEHETALLRIDPETGAVVGDFILGEFDGRPVHGDFRGFAGGRGALNAFAVGHGGLWFWTMTSPTGEREESFVGRLGVETLEVDARVEVTDAHIDAALSPSGDTLWFANYADTVTRIALR